MNTSNFSNTPPPNGDHTTGSGKMMVVDGSGNGGDKVWELINGSSIGVVSGSTYNFSYWIRSISGTNTALNSAIIGINTNGTTSAPVLVSGPTTCPIGNPSVWTKVTYSWTATTNNAQIWLTDNQTNGGGAGNDFALDDISLTLAPVPLSLTYSITNLTCNTTNDGTIFGYGIGGSGTYTNYILSGPIPPTNSATGFFTGLAPGNYSLSVTDSAGITFPLNGIIIPNPPVLSLVAASPTICAGSSTSLTASGGGTTYTWSVDQVSEPIPTGANPNVSPLITTTYTVNSTTVTSNNLIYNGDFFLGNLGFTSDYNFYTSNTTNAQKAYGVVSNPNTFEVGFQNCVDHTSGTGKMMVVDGSTSNGGNDKVWCQTIPVIPGQNYTFTYWIQTLALPSPANIEVLINGVAIGSDLAPNVLCSTIATPWILRSYAWASNTNTTAQICIYNRNIASSGNDFAIDDLVFSRVNTCALPPKSVTVTVTNTVNLIITNPSAVCLPGTVDITAPSVTVGSTLGLTLTYWTDIAATTSPISLAAAAIIGTSGTYYIRATLGTCSIIKPVTVTLTPAGSVAAPTATSPIYYCQGSVALPLIATALSGATLNWYGTNATGGTPSVTAPTPSTAVNGTTTYYVSQTVGTCESPRKAINVIVNSSTGTINMFCDGANSTPTSVAFDWNNVTGHQEYYLTYSINGGPLVNAVSNNLSSFVVPGVLPGQSVTLTITSVLGVPCVAPVTNTCSNCTTSTTPTFTFPTSICSNLVAPILPTSSTNGVTGTWSPLIVSTTASGNYVFTPDPILFPCAINVTKTITVTNPPTTVLAGINVCVGSTTTFTSSTPGGTWSSANTAIATVNPTTGLITGIISGTVSIDYTFPAAGGCAAVVFSRPLTVTNPPTAGILNGNQTICVGDTSTFASTIVGGSWISSNTAIATINATTGVITGVSSGTATITYSVNGTGGCSPATISRTVTVSSIPNAGVLSGTQAICIGLSSTLTSTVPGGTWSSSNTSIATIANTGVVIGVAAGTATMSYIVNGTGGCPASLPATRIITVSAPQNPGILSGIQSICAGSTSTFSSTVLGGIWSSSNTSVATVNASTGVITGISAGSANIKYEFVGTGGCASTNAIRTITVNTNVTPTFNSVLPVCSGNPLTPLPLTSINGITGTWSPALDNTLTTPYIFTPSLGQCATTTQLIITVDQRVTPLFGLSFNVCQGDAPPVLQTSSNNVPPITGTWTPPVVNTAILGTTVYTFNPTPGQCVSTILTTLSITVVPVLTPDFLAIPAFCDGFPAPVLLNTSPNLITGIWVPSTIDNTISSSYVFNPTPGQCALNQTLNVTIIPRTIPDFTLLLPFCKGSTPPVLNLTSINGITGTWSPATVDNSVSGIFPYLFTPDATECATPFTLFAEVTEPEFPGFPDLAFCNGAIAPPLPAISPNGINGTWVPATIDNTVSSTYQFTPLAGECATPQTLTVTINQYTLVGIGGIVTNYFEDNQVITVLATAAGNYLYQLDYGTLQESNVFQYVGSGIHVIRVIDANGCSSPLSQEVLVINYPKFFTPNDDSYNDTWNIFGLADQVNSTIYIFDRHGKLLKEISPNGKGWDGTFNGQRLPADDYWFLVKYSENGGSNEFKAHFSLKR
jgi:gliding motility-associated-like protein